MADNGKINHEKGMFCAAAWTFPFLNSRIKGYGYGQKKGDSGHDNVCGCIGFVKDRNTRLNVPNTLLKKDIREIRDNYTPKGLHEKDFDECREDIKHIKSEYLTKDDFIREMNKMDRKLDQMLEIMLSK